MAGKGKYRKVPINDNGFDSDDDEDDFIQKQIRNQRMQLKKQDEGLEMLSMSASRLGELSMNIHTELEDQNRYVKLFSKYFRFERLILLLLIGCFPKWMKVSYKTHMLLG